MNTKMWFGDSENVTVMHLHVDIELDGQLLLHHLLLALRKEA